MDPDLLSHVLVLIPLFFISAFFSATEVSIFSLTKLDLEKLRKAKHPKYRVIKEIVKNPQDTLITILIGNDLTNILITIVSVTILYKIFYTKPWWVISLFSIAITTPLLLIFGEITPKTLAARFNISFATVACDAITVIAKILTPIRWLISQFTYFIVSTLSFASEEKDSIGEDEFKMLVNESKKEGIIGEEEESLIYNVFKLGDKTVRELMTKKDDIFSLSIDESYEKLLETVRINSYSRIPIYEQDTDIIVGILLKKDLLSLVRSQKNNESFIFDIRKIIREPYFVPLHKKADSVFRELKAKKLHIAIVVDEFGKLAGLITMEDILRELFGKK